MASYPTDTVRRLRTAAGLSQRVLAQRAGTSQPAIARYEGGRSTPSWETLERIAMACGWRARIEVEPVPDPGDVELAERLLAMTPIERLRSLAEFARLRSKATR